MSEPGEIAFTFPTRTMAWCFYSCVSETITRFVGFPSLGSPYRVRVIPPDDLLGDLAAAVTKFCGQLD